MDTETATVLAELMELREALEHLHADLAAVATATVLLGRQIDWQNEALRRIYQAQRAHDRKGKHK